jgi:hypothetical protein
MASQHLPLGIIMGQRMQLAIRLTSCLQQPEGRTATCCTSCVKGIAAFNETNAVISTLLSSIHASKQPDVSRRNKRLHLKAASLRLYMLRAGTHSLL